MAHSLRGPIATKPIYQDMRGKVALVTGGTCGVGLATAGAFARQRTKVVIASRREATAKAALKQLSSLGDVHWFSADAADGKSVTRLMDAIMNAHGHLDYAFNNGGSGGRLAPVAKNSPRLHGFFLPDRAISMRTENRRVPRICKIIRRFS